MKSQSRQYLIKTAILETIIFVISVTRNIKRDVLGTPDTNLSGLRTRKARNAFTSNPFWSSVDKIVLTNLEAEDAHTGLHQITCCSSIVSDDEKKYLLVLTNLK